jgi:hypothetical protein
MMGTLVFLCPATGQEVSAGIEIDATTFKSLHHDSVHCPHCQAPHQMSGIRAWIAGHDLIDIPPDQGARSG